MAHLDEVREFVQACDQQLHRQFEFRVEDVSDSGSGGGNYTMVGHAAVYNRWSLDLGGFREKIAKGAFDEVLSRDPHVVHVIDHDTSKVLSSTRNKTLELSSDPKGLRYWSKVAPTSYAADLRVLLERGDITQSSFAFTVARDEWRVVNAGQDNESVERMIVEVGDLYDVTTCAMGAYPATDSALALRSLVSGRRNFSFGTGLMTVAEMAQALGGGTDVAPDDPAGTPQTPDEGVVSGDVADLKRASRAAVQAARERFMRGRETT